MQTLATFPFVDAGGLAGRCYLKTSAARKGKNRAFTSGVTGAPSPTPIGYDGPAISAFATGASTKGKVAKICILYCTVLFLSDLRAVDAVSDDQKETAVFLGYWSNSDSFVTNRTVTVKIVGGASVAKTAMEYRIDGEYCVMTHHANTSHYHCCNCTTKYNTNNVTGVCL